MTSKMMLYSYVYSWLKDKEHISDGVVTREGRSVLKLNSVKQNTTLTCRVVGLYGEASKNARVSIIKKGRFKAILYQVNLLVLTKNDLQ